MAVPPARGASGVDPLRLIITGLRTMLLLLSLWELALSNFLPLPPRLPITSSVVGTVSGLDGWVGGWVMVGMAEARFDLIWGKEKKRQREERYGASPSLDSCRPTFYVCEMWKKTLLERGVIHSHTDRAYVSRTLCLPL